MSASGNCVSGSNLSEKIGLLGFYSQSEYKNGTCIVMVWLCKVWVLVSGLGYLFAGSGYQFFCNAPQIVVMCLFSVMQWHITQHVQGRGGCIVKKKWCIARIYEALQTLVPGTCKLVPETRTHTFAGLDTCLMPGHESSIWLVNYL